MAAKEKGFRIAYCVGLVNGEALGYEIDIETGRTLRVAPLDSNGTEKIALTLLEWVAADRVQKIVKNGHL